MKYGTTTPIDAQLQMYADGSFTIYLNRVATDCLVGIGEGNSAPDPGPVDLSVGVTNGGPTVYELFTAGAPCDLAQSFMRFVPNGVGGYDVATLPTSPLLPATQTLRGAGCPAASGTGGSIREIFNNGGSTTGFDLVGQSVVYTKTSTGYDVSLAPSLMWDTPGSGSQVSGVPYYITGTNKLDQNNPVMWLQGDGDDGLSKSILLGFSTTYWGTPTSAFEFSPNGVVFFGPGGFSGPNTSTWAGAGPAGVKVDSCDLDTTAGGDLWLDSYAASGSTPAKTVLTWDNAPKWSNPPLSSGETLTMQVQMYANGDIVCSYQSNNLTSRQQIAIFEGHGPAPATATDYSMALAGGPLSVMAGNPVVPLTLTSQLFYLGTAPIAVVGNAPVGTIGLALHIGIDQPTIPLDAIGMPGCEAETTPIGFLLMAPRLNGGETTLGTIPASPSLVGGLVTLQGVAVHPGNVNALGITASNAIDGVIGY